MIDKKELQRTWDEELLNGYYSDRNMMSLFSAFLRKHFPEFIDENYHCTEDGIYFLSQLGLRRCTDVNGKGESILYRWGNVRTFVHKRSPSLAKAFLTIPDLHFSQIKKFKWKKQLINKQARNEQNKNYYRKQSKAREATITIKARSLSKKHDWNTVK